ncbi:MAG: Asp-tRNA(Asn)/Glu-tRNA(Gln) amidotransferase GatCAB subunit B, partial [Campylobacteraceae bacterium]|nr:Asp-tRNA(Asn)/Glu-tRNA(Gln) amidotransferase GatCAB subunit B [Campylobacteraceae bacterium]
ETRLFDIQAGVTRSMRGKEDSAEYRYFPDPDLLPLVIPDFMMEEGRIIPELPDEKKNRLVKEHDIKEYDASVITDSVEMARYFEEMISHGASPKMSVTWLTVELLGRLSHGVTIENCKVNASTLADLVNRIEDGTISGKAGKEVLDELVLNGGRVDELIEKLGLKQVSDDGAILTIIDEILENNKDKVAQYKDGKDKLFGFFVGQTMKASKGTANPSKVNELLISRLDG